MHDDFDRCYRAVQSKDARFDGWFVTAVPSWTHSLGTRQPSTVPLDALETVWLTTTQGGPLWASSSG
jgi:hypothetical protein